MSGPGAAIAVALVFLPLASSLSRADTAVLVALPSEQSALSREIRIVGQPVELAQHRISIGYHKGEKLYIVRTGAGNLNSAMVTQALLTRYRIDRVISIGVAGNLAGGEVERGKGESAFAKATADKGRESEADSRRLNADSFHIGDLLVVTDVVNHQQGKETPTGFEVKEQQPSAISRQPSTSSGARRCGAMRWRWRRRL